MFLWKLNFRKKPVQNDEEHDNSPHASAKNDEVKESRIIYSTASSSKDWKKNIKRYLLTCNHFDSGKEICCMCPSRLDQHMLWMSLISCIDRRRLPNAFIDESARNRCPFFRSVGFYWSPVKFDHNHIFFFDYSHRPNVWWMVSKVDIFQSLTLPWTYPARSHIEREYPELLT